MAGRPASFDLLAWPRVAAARARVEAAEAARELAAHRVRYAPHGQILNRRRAFQEATEEALKAEAELADVAERALT